jgi:hypothetical protein
MKTLALVNGDLAIGTNGAYLLYSGASRIKQDLTLALTEEYGTDRFHPTYGSIVQGYLGQVLSAELMQLVRAEVNRVLQNYLIIQQNEVLRDSLVDVANRYDTSDVGHRLHRPRAARRPAALPDGLPPAARYTI